jgi:hypothetical protein
VSPQSGPPFDDLVGGDVAGEERERLRRVHDLLVAAGPPPELPESLATPPGIPRDPTITVLPPNVPRRRLAATLVLAAALALGAFGAGFLVGDRGLEEEAFAVDFVVPMHGTPAAPEARASLAVGELDDDGNWPMRMTVRNLPELPEGGRYELFLTRKGKLADSCGKFLIEGEKAVVPLNAPYPLRDYDGWVVVPEGTQRVVLEALDDDRSS